MGIKGKFRSTLRKLWPEAFEDIYLDDLSGKLIAVDIMGLVYSYKACFEDWPVALQENLQKKIDKKINMVIVFEGKSPDEKAAEQASRRKQKEATAMRISTLSDDLIKFMSGEEPSELLHDAMKKVGKRKTPTNATYAKIIEDEIIEEEEYVEPKEITIERLQNYIDRLIRQTTPPKLSDVERICNNLNLLTIRAPGEAEHLCAWFCKNNIVDAVWSEDSDLIPLQCPIILSKSSLTGRILKFDLQKLYKLCELTPAQLIDWAILCGTDYNTSIYKIGVVRSLDIIKKFTNIDVFIQDVNKNFLQYKITVDDIAGLNHVCVRRIFLCSDLDSDDYCNSLATLILNKFKVV